jgi:hypothetical protein
MADVTQQIVYIEFRVNIEGQPRSLRTGKKDQVVC